jgi:hypothetical protein
MGWRGEGVNSDGRRCRTISIQYSTCEVAEHSPCAATRFWRTYSRLVPPKSPGTHAVMWETADPRTVYDGVSDLRDSLSENDARNRCMR